MVKPEKSKILIFLKSFGFFVLYLFLTILVAGTLIYLLGSVWGLNNNVTGGVPLLLICYFWGIFFLQKQGYKKIMGIILFTIGVLFDLLLVASPYDKQTEFISTRIFIIPAVGAGIYLICRHSLASKILGILLVIISLFAALLGAVFMWAK